MSPARTLLLLPLLAVAVVSFVFVRVHQGDGGILVGAHTHAHALTPAAVARVVREAPDPVTRVPGESATCSALGSGDLRNPWRCAISYSSGRRIEYLLEISARGSYTGRHELVHYRGRAYPDTGTISGCCIAIP